jgi:ligand-binding sensor domain-containing protein
LYRRRPDGVVELYDPKAGLPIQNVLFEDRAGTIWAGTNWGLCQLVPDPQPDQPIVARRYTTKDGLAYDSITSLCQSASGKLWVGTARGLCERLAVPNKEGRSFQSYTMENGLCDKAIDELTEDHDGNLWMGTPYGGVMRLAASGLASYKEADGLGGSSIGAVFETRSGELCVLSDPGHLDRFDGRRFTGTQLRLPKPITYWGWGWYQTTFQDSRGEWWMATGEGLVRYPKLAQVEELSRTRPRAIYTTREGLPANEIFRLFEDSHGDIWISTLGNPQGVLTRWERATESFHVYPFADIQTESAPTAFCEDASGDLWIGLYRGGLLRYGQGRFTLLTAADGVPAGFVRSLYLDHASRLWVATAEGE